MAGDPVGRIVVVETVGAILVREHVQEKLSIRLHPVADALQQHAPVRHVLEHFHRNHAVVSLVGREVVHVGGDDGEIVQPESFGAVKNVGALGGGVRDGCDTRIRELLCEIE